MNKHIQHILKIAVAFALAAFASVASAQTVAGTQVKNQASALFQHPNGTPDTAKTNLVVTTVEQMGGLTLDKTASPGRVAVLGAVSFKLNVKNLTNANLTNVIVRDTLPAGMQFITATKGSVANGVFSYTYATFAVNAQDSITIVGQVLDQAYPDSNQVNRAYVTDGVLLASDTARYIISNNHPVGNPQMSVSKFASLDQMTIGTAFTFTVRFVNTGDVRLTNISVTDTVPNGFTILAASHGATSNGNIVSLLSDSLGVGKQDSLIITVVATQALTPNAAVTNRAYALSSEVPVQQSSATVTPLAAPADVSCMLNISASPKSVAGNGTSSAVISVFLSDTLGNAKPDGTPIVFRTSFGFFSNGRDSILVLTKNGFVVDSIRALIPSNQTFYGKAYIEIPVGGPCQAGDSLELSFYAGAIGGVIIDGSKNEPYAGATVEAINSLSQVVSQSLSDERGEYVLPVQNSGEYTLRISTVNKLNQSVVMLNNVTVTLPTSGGFPPVPTPNSTSGTLFFRVSGKPIPLANVRVDITADSLSNTSSQRFSKVLGRQIDSTTSDNNGLYFMHNLPTGNFDLSVTHPFLQGSSKISFPKQGIYLLDANTPVTLVLTGAITKTGPLVAAPKDTGSYVITLKNPSPIALSGAMLVDTLDPLMNFLAADQGGNYDGVGHRVIWNLGSLDSNSVNVFTVTVAYKDTVPARLLNAPATLTANEIDPLSAVAKTQLLPPPPVMQLAMGKLSSAGVIAVGNAVQYKIWMQNTGEATMKNITMRDTLPSALVPQSVSANATISGAVVSYQRDSLQVNEVDTVIVSALVAANRPSHESITNVAYASADSTPKMFAANTITTFVPVPNTSCVINVSATPAVVIGNGSATTRIEAFISDTLGNPKPNGTYVVMRSALGYFSNGLDSIVLRTINGRAVDSLRAVVSGAVANARAFITVSDSGTCSANSYVDVVFFPGALAGVVVDRITGQPVAGATVIVYNSAGQVVGTVITGDDGSYLVPVQTTDTYRTNISYVDYFEQEVSANVTATVAVPGTGGNPPVLNKNLISGKVYFYVSNKPIEARNVKVLLIQTGSPNGTGSRFRTLHSNRGVVMDSTSTDSTGTYTFVDVLPGTYVVETSDPSIRGTLDVGTVNQGVYVINVNIPITLNPVILFTKTGPSTAFSLDTASYFIHLENTGNYSTTATTVRDSLDERMVLLDATAPYTYNAASRKITWNVGILDSAAGPSHARDFFVKVRFIDTISTAQSLTNFALLRSNEVADTMVNVNTTVVPPALRITKRALRPLAEIGDVETYILTVSNTMPLLTLKNVRIEDRTPFGFSYLANSTASDSVRLAEPTQSKGMLIWNIADSLRPGETKTILYRLVVGAGGAEGNGINTAQAFAFTPAQPAGSPIEVASPVAQARVEVRPGMFGANGLVIGKIFFDNNHNLVQDPDEDGVKGVELMVEDGTRVTTGDGGKYSLPNVVPGEHVIRMRRHTLPAGAEVEVGYNDFAGDGMSRFVTVPAGGIARADFYLAYNTPDTIALSQSVAKVGDIEVRRIAYPRNVVFIEDERRALMKLTGLNFDVAKATLKAEALPTLMQLASIMNDNADVFLTITGHTDTSKIHTKEFPNNTKLSFARANAVKTFLAANNVDTSRVIALGYGEFRPIVWNKTKEGKAANRRVEFSFDREEKPPVRETQNIFFKVPIHYEGSVSVSKLTLTDELDTAFTFIEGSGLLDTIPIEPVREANKLMWTIPNIGTSFHHSLVYRVTVTKPSAKIATLPSSTSQLAYTVGDSVIAVPDTLATTNQVAVAIRGRAMNYVLSGVLFDVAESTLREKTSSALANVADELKKDPTATVLVEGHTDSNPIHSKKFPSNTELSLARATTVMEQLTNEFGIAPERMRVAGYGPFRPVAPNTTSEGRQSNRRVEIRVYRKDFVESVIPEGFVDSSALARKEFMPTQKHLSDTMTFAEVGTRFLFKLEVRRPVSAKTASAMLVDSLPKGLELVEGSLEVVRGVDTVHHSRVIAAKLKNEAISTITFLAEVRGPITVGEWINHKFVVVRNERKGTVLVDEQKSIAVEVKQGMH